MAESGIRLPIFPVLCGQLHTFGQKRNWPDGLDRFSDVASKAGAVSVGLCLSPSGSPTDRYHKVLRLFDATARVGSYAKLAVFSWRQGIYGPSLVAAGSAGYETGIGTNEQTNIAGTVGNRRPRAGGTARRGGAAPGVFLVTLGRSIPFSAAEALFGDIRIRAKVMCPDELCCPDGPRSTLEQHRQHAVRSRAKALLELDEMPQRAWRLNQTAHEARASATLIDQANKTLELSLNKHRLNATAMQSIAAVTEFLGNQHLGMA
jgi:hypothetical protein